MSNTPIEFKKWLRGVTNFCADVFRTGACGPLKLVTFKRLSPQEADEQLAALDPKWQEAVDFLQGFYTEIGAGFEFSLGAVLNQGWEPIDKGKGLSCGLCVMTPEILMERIAFREEALDTVPPGLYPVESALVIPYYLIEANRVQVAIFEDCLDFCWDDVGGTFAFFPGNGAYKKGIYATHMELAFFVSETFDGFLERLDQNCYLWPISANQWKSEWGPQFRERLKNENGA